MRWQVSILDLGSIDCWKTLRGAEPAERRIVVLCTLIARNEDYRGLLDILASVGAEADDERIELLLSQVKGKDITELIAAGREKLASVPSGGGAVAVAAPAAGAGGGAAPAAAETKKEEKVEEKEESDDDMGFSLFECSA
ncbi:unnamed protein product [Fraxinus pennsylvanica]|uniref:60S acidic ribosomal protein P2 n=1 Tax=Fraxinus pennsylvanica TaxID=56036 RepID=A0AAD2ACU8_9LAMI|nr:unnamed protein product [Fraxinus pennsylvanica]